MTIVSAEQKYKARLREVQLYLDFIDRANRPMANLFTGRRTIVIHNDLRKMLRAAFFLIFYNLVEATFADAFLEIYSEATVTRNLAFYELDLEWQALVAKRHLSGKGNDYRLIADLMHRASLNERIELDIVPIPANVDQKVIRKWCNRHKINFVAPKLSRDGVDLEVIRKKRNELAHGDSSFEEVGREYTVKDLFGMQRRASLYIRAVIQGAERYRAANGYKRAP